MSETIQEDKLFVLHHSIKQTIYRVGQKMAQFILNTLTLSNINRFSKFFHCQNQGKFVITLSLKIPSHLKCVATLPC